MMTVKYLLLFLLIPLVGFSQTLYQGQGNSSDDNPPGLEEAWKYKYSRQGSFRSPYGNLESEIPESYGNSPSRMTVNGKGHATKCRPKEYRKTFELPPEAFADFCEAKMGKSYKEEKAKAAAKHYKKMIQKYYGQHAAQTGSFKKVKGNSRRNQGGKGSYYDPNKFIINTAADLAGALKAAKQGKEIHDHRNGHKACSKCHSNKVAAKKHKELREVQKFQKETLKKHEEMIKSMFNSLPSQKIGKSKKLPTRQPRTGSRGRAARKPASSGSSGGGSFSSPTKKPDLGYSYSHSKGSSVLINYQPNKKNKGGTKYEWGTQNK